MTSRRGFIQSAGGAALWPAAADTRASTRAADPRNYATGLNIPGKAYICQNYMVVTDEGQWLCTPTVGPAEEGNRAQQIVSTLSADRGRTWSPFVDVEPPGPPEASWAMPLKIPGGRIYVFYTYNIDNISHYKGQRIRADTLGQMVFKYSDDHGRSWSAQRYVIPSRRFAIDRQNFSDGEILLMWGVCQPIIAGGAVYFGIAKVGIPSIWSGPTEGALLRSDNLLTEKDPGKIRWEMLPEGEVGLRAPRGNIAEEVFLAPLESGGLYANFRTTDGCLGQATSTDRGRTWTSPACAVYEPGGRPIKNPRGPATMRRFSNGKYLMHFYNRAGYLNRTDARPNSRNPGWLSGGVEKNGAIHWSQPEICDYVEDEYLGVSYPDFIEDAGRYYLAPTTKLTARIMQLDPRMLEGLWNQRQIRQAAREGLVLEVPSPRPSERAAAPRLADLGGGGGFAIDFRVRFSSLAPDQVLLDSRGSGGKGIVLHTTAAGSIAVDLRDGSRTTWWDTDLHLIRENRWHHIAVIVDGGPKIITFVVDGKLCDGGTERDQGWTRFRSLGDLNGADRLTLAGNLRGELRSVRIYDRYLRTSEAVGNFQAAAG